MAYYNYKVVRDQIPADFEDRYEQEFNKKNGEGAYDADANYDGHRWLLTAEYIEYLQATIAKGSEITVAKWFREPGVVHF